MSEMNLDDALRELQRELAVVPSAGFAAGVRERVSRESRHHGQAWMWLAAAAALATVATAAIIWSRPANRVAPDLRVATAQSTPDPAVAAGKVPGRILPATTSSARRVPRRQSLLAPTKSTQRNAATAPEFLVLTSQPEILQKMWKGVEKLAVLDTDDSMPLPTRPSEIVVAPVKVDPVLVHPFGPQGDTGAGAGVPIIRRVTTHASPRSPQ
jgi:hypothetical protein